MRISSDLRPRRRWQRLVDRHSALLIGLVIVHSGLLAYSASIHSPVIDEPGHLAAGLSHWRLADFAAYRVNSPLVRLVATAPLLASSIKTDWTRHSRDPKGRPEFVLGEYLVRVNGSNVFRYFTVARWACIPFSLVGLLISYQWAKLLFGKGAGLAAASLWCFSPTILGHGSLMTADVGGTAVGLAACYTFFRWLIAPRWQQTILAGVVLGGAEACKSTWIILFAAFPCIWLVYRMAWNRGRTRPTIMQLATILVLGWGLLIGIYGGQGVGVPLGTLWLKSELFRGILCEPTSGGEDRIRPSLARLPLLLPNDYVLGLDQQRSDLEGPNASFLQGEWRDRGWRHYYAYGLAVKEPVGMLALATLSLLFWSAVVLWRPLREQFSGRRRFLVATSGLVAICPLVVFILASAQTGMNHHMRYVMPVLPYLHILAGGLMTRSGPWRRWRWMAGMALIAYAVVSSLLVYPHSLSYFNELVGGPKGGVRHLNNSNIDWGQDLLLLSQWKRKHAPDEPIYVAYFGRVNPTYAGIDYRLPPRVPRNMSPDDRHQVVDQLARGWYAVSVTLLQGRAYKVQTPDGEWVTAEQDAFSYFQGMAPFDCVGYSIYVYRAP